MMGSRGCKGAAEYDCFSHRYRRLRAGLIKPGHNKSIKRRFWKRMRKQARLALLRGE